MNYHYAIALFTLATALLLPMGNVLRAQESQPTTAVAAEPALIPYPLSTCVVSGETLGEMGEPFVFEYEGHEIKLCCKACEAKFRKDADSYLAKLEIKPCPLTTCIVSGEALGGMGEPIRIVYEGQEVKFCCKGCIGKFKKDPETFLKKMDEQAAKQK